MVHRTPLDERLERLGTRVGHTVYGIVHGNGRALLVERDPEAELGVSP